MWAICFHIIHRMAYSREMAKLAQMILKGDKIHSQITKTVMIKNHSLNSVKTAVV